MNPARASDDCEGADACPSLPKAYPRAAREAIIVSNVIGAGVRGRSSTEEGRDVLFVSPSSSSSPVRAIRRATQARSVAVASHLADLERMLLYARESPVLSHATSEDVDAHLQGLERTLLRARTSPALAALALAPPPAPAPAPAPFGQLHSAQLDLDRHLGGGAYGLRVRLL